MDTLQIITEKIVKHSKDILGDNLVGIYLHGSAVMAASMQKTSDIVCLLY